MKNGLIIIKYIAQQLDDKMVCSICKREGHNKNNRAFHPIDGTDPVLPITVIPEIPEIHEITAEEAIRVYMAFKQRQSEANARYREKHSDEIKKKRAEFYEANKEEMRAKNAEYKRQQRLRDKIKKEMAALHEN